MLYMKIRVAKNIYRYISNYRDLVLKTSESLEQSLRVQNSGFSLLFGSERTRSSIGTTPI